MTELRPRLRFRPPVVRRLACRGALSRPGLSCLGSFSRLGSFPRLGSFSPLGLLSVLGSFSCLGALSCLGPVSAVAADHLFVLTTDYETGSCSRVELESPWDVGLDLESVGSDPVARYFGGKIYVVNRFGSDNVQVIDPVTYQTLHQHSVGAGSNPQDLIVLSEHRAYVSLYDRDDLIEFDPVSGAVLDEISLAPLADADGLPESAALFFRSPYLYVHVQRLDRNNFYEPVSPSCLGVIDVRDNTLVDVDSDRAGIQGIELAATNPLGRLVADITRPERLLVSCAGSFSDPFDGGLEGVDLGTWTTEGVLASGAELGGDLLRIEPANDGTAYALLSDESFVTCVKRVDLVSGDVLSTTYCAEGFDLVDCVVGAEGLLYVADRSFFDPGVRVFDAGSGSPASAGVIAVGLPPVQFLVIRDETSSVDQSLPAGGLISPVHPNPATGTVRWSFARQIPDGSLSILDSQGRLVRSLPNGATGWDGLDQTGRRTPSGAYWLRYDSRLGTFSRPIRRLAR